MLFMLSIYVIYVIKHIEDETNPYEDRIRSVNFTIYNISD